MITKETARAITRQGQLATILKVIAEINHEIEKAAKEGYDGIYTDLHTRKLDKVERRTIRLSYEALGYTKVRIGKRSCNIEWGE